MEVLAIYQEKILPSILELWKLNKLIRKSNDVILEICFLLWFWFSIERVPNILPADKLAIQS